MPRDRAYRRDKLARMKRRALGKLTRVFGWTQMLPPDLVGCFGIRPNARDVGRAATDRKPCSCWACGNQRRMYGPPRNEIRAPGSRRKGRGQDCK